MHREKNAMKTQSNIIHTTTYIMVILVVGIALGVLFGLFFGVSLPLGTSVPTACIAQSGFLCKASSFITPYANAGTLNATIGQASGTNWATANIAFLNLSQLPAPATPSYWGAANIVQFSSGINSGTQVSVSIPVNSLSSTAIGTAIQGQIWAQYTNSSGGSEYYTEIATVTAKSVG